jgi:hypothetical protein
MLETDALDYALAAIFSIYTPDGGIHPVMFHSRSFNPMELNYDTHDKEVLAISEPFKHWCQYFEGSGTLIDVVTDHKNLEYLATTKLLTRCQARWSEFLSQFNMVIHFHPGKLGAKPDALTRQWDVYRKGGNSDFAMANLSNFQPIMDIQRLHNDICSSLPLNPISVAHLPTPTAPSWTLDESGLLHQYNQIYVPNVNDLCLKVLQYNHDHILTRHTGQNKTLDLIHQD